MRLTPDQQFVERYSWVGAVGIMTLGFILRIRGLSEYWLNPDEGIYYSTLTRSSFGEFWTEVMANAHPPAFYLLLRGLGFFTWDFVWLRGTSLLFGTAAIGIMWLLGRELGGGGRAGAFAGLVAAALLSVNREAIALSQILRPYMLLLALLGLALFHLLRCRSQPTDRNLGAYVGYSCLALLTHYSAALALGVFLVLAAYFALTRVVEGEAMRRLAKAQAIPTVLLITLYLLHLGPSFGSDLMGDALASGGWLSGWLVASPDEAWQGFINFQVFHLPSAIRGFSALVLLVAIGVSTARSDRTVAVLTGTALTVALVVALLGFYPVGASRHNTWLVVFTLPAFGWLAGQVIERGPRASLVVFTTVAGILLFGSPLERALGARPLPTNGLEEQVIRTDDLAPLVVERLGLEGEPRVILMSEQTYNLMMPLYPSVREDVSVSADGSLFRFAYGTREVIVVRRWDWEGIRDVRATLLRLPGDFPGSFQDASGAILLMAGGWGSSLFLDLGELEESGAIVDWQGVLGDGPGGEPVWRLAAFVLDRAVMLGEV